jgi:glycosyltransferase involved in cell wall biosynthesis
MEIPGDLLKQASIIVCTVDRPTDLDRCVASLVPFREAGAEIVVVNNGPRSATVEEIAQGYGARATTEPRRGLCHARNAGIRFTTGTILAFIDDDAQADPAWIPLLLAPFADPRVLAVVGSVWAQTVADPVSQVFDRIYLARMPKSQLLLEAPGEMHALPLRLAMQGTGSSMAIRREVFDRFGYFDTRFGRGTRIGSGEEADLLLALLLGGGKIVVEPAARIFHRHPTAPGAVRRWAFQSGCAHTAILTKYFLQEPSLRGQVLRYAASRLRRRTTPEASAAANFKVPRMPLLLGSLYGPIAFLLSGKG